MEGEGQGERERREWSEVQEGKKKWREEKYEEEGRDRGRENTRRKTRVAWTDCVQGNRGAHWTRAGKK